MTTPTAAQWYAAQAKIAQQEAALLLCQLVLHPGAVGLIANHHGEQDAQRACNAVYSVRYALTGSIAP